MCDASTREKLAQAIEKLLLNPLPVIDTHAALAGQQAAQVLELVRLRLSSNAHDHGVVLSFDDVIDISNIWYYGSHMLETRVAELIAQLPTLSAHELPLPVKRLATGLPPL